MKPTGVALTVATSGGGMAVVWNLLCPRLAMLEPGEQAALHTMLVTMAAAVIAIAVRVSRRLSRWAERELAATPAPTGSRAFRLEILAGLHEGER